MCSLSEDTVLNLAKSLIIAIQPVVDAFNFDMNEFSLILFIHQLINRFLELLIADLRFISWVFIL